MTKPQNDFGHYRRCSRTGCATPRRGAFQLLMGSRQVELERQFGETATYLAGSACGKNPLPSLDEAVRVALLLYHLLCRRDPSFLNNIPKATPFVSQPPDGPRY